MKDYVAEVTAKWAPFVLALILALWGATANYISRLNKTEAEFKTAALIGEWVISGFVGFIAILLCMEYEVSVYMSGAIAGIAGHQGGRGLFILEAALKDYIKKKTGS